MNNMKNRKVFINCDVYTGEKILTQNAVLVSGDKIIALPEIREVSNDAEIIDLGGKILAPGYIDIQINGGGGILFNNDTTVEALQIISKAHARFGVLNFCPTLISTGIDTIYNALDAIRESIKENIGILGAHIEGPFLEKTKAGIHEKKYIHAASDKEIIDILMHSNGSICIMTVAPEAISNTQIETITNSGVRVFIGHTNATCEQVLTSFQHGAIGVTHLFNAMSQLGSRETGVVGASFIDNKSWAGIIIDGLHVNFKAVQIAKNIKGKRLILVTDAMPPVGKSDAIYEIGEYRISCIEGKCATADGTLAGSALDMASAVRNAVQKCGIPQDEAIRMASSYVAEMLGIEDKIGYIKPGMLADMIILNGQLNVEAIVRRGDYTAF